MEALVVTLETAQKLKAAGFPQRAEYLWVLRPGEAPELEVYFYQDKVGFEVCAAPTAQEIADQLVEKKYQLRVEFNHSDMKWYAYYAGKFGSNELEIDGSGASTMAEALAALFIKLKEPTS